MELFNYITENEFIGKKSVISYILNNLVEVKPLGDNKESEVINLFRQYIVENHNSKKSKFLELCVTSQYYDDIIIVLSEISDIDKRRKRTPREKELLEIYKEFLRKIKSCNNRKDV